MNVVIVRHGRYPAPAAIAWHLWQLGVHVELVTIGARPPDALAEPSPYAEHAVPNTSMLDRYRELRPLVEDADVIHYFPGKGMELLPFLNRRAATVFNHISVSVTGRPLQDLLINLGKRVQPLFAAHVIFADEPLARILRRPRPGMPMTLLPVGFADELFFPCPPPPGRPVRRLVYHGDLRPPRQLEDLIAALAKLPADYRLTMIGGAAGADVDRERLRRVAQAAGCSERLELVHRPQSKIRDLICESDLCVGYVPMQECYQDQWVMKNAECLACQRPVVTTATRFTRSFSQELGPDALLLSDGTIDDLVAKVLQAESYVYRFYTAGNLKRVSAILDPYSVRDIVKTRLMPLYESLVRSSRARFKG